MTRLTEQKYTFLAFFDFRKAFDTKTAQCSINLEIFELITLEFGKGLNRAAFDIYITELAKLIAEDSVGVHICYFQIGWLVWADDVVLS